MYFTLTQKKTSHLQRKNFTLTEKKFTLTEKNSHSPGLRWPRGFRSSLCIPCRPFHPLDLSCLLSQQLVGVEDALGQLALLQGLDLLALRFDPGNESL